MEQKVSLPEITLGNMTVSRLIVGGNPFRGNSHQSPELDREMESYYTVARIKSVLSRCEQEGITAVQARGDALILACLREHWAEGGHLRFIAQSASEFRDLHGHVRHLARFGAAAIYVHGSYVDRCFRENEMGAVHDLLRQIRDTGVSSGIGTHQPEVLDFVESSGWDLDFYMTSLYNLSRQPRESALVSGSFQEEVFEESDRDRMFPCIQAVSRPCLVFKVLGAGRRCISPEAVRETFSETLARIKPYDAIVVGMYPRNRDEIAENAAYIRTLHEERSQSHI